MLLFLLLIYKSILKILYFDQKMTKLLFYGCTPPVFELAVDFEPAFAYLWRRCLA